MTTKILVPELGESVVEATVSTWHKQVGDAVAVGDVLVSLETDKVDLEVSADVTGVLAAIEQNTDNDVRVGDVLGVISNQPSAISSQQSAISNVATSDPSVQQLATSNQSPATPVAKRLASAENIDLTTVQGSGKGGKITKADVQAVSQQPSAISQQPSTPIEAIPNTEYRTPNTLSTLLGTDPRQERIKMSRRRRTIAKRLVEAQQTAAMLTTFNEIDMSAVIDLRKRRKAWFEEKYGTRLGYTSFFTKAAVAALQAFPRLNAEIDGDEMVLKYHYDIGIAVGAEEGLVVPVLRDADKMSFADIEKKVRAFGKASRDGTLSLADLIGGTFTITNGGIFGSMLSTPILNPPQVGILGLHNIVERPVAVDGEVVIRPIMYVALSYDHRIVDGREAVQFLYRIKELIEDPEDLMLAG